ncbi:MAG: hypothetical protein R3C61_16490 [Bacteroidia bacterium]
MFTKSTIFLSLLFFIAVLPMPAQVSRDCERDYSPLRTTAQPTPEEIQAGAEVYLSRAYLQAVEEGYFDRSPSGMQHWVYVRPASRKELKESPIPANIPEKVAKDGNIYTLSRTPSSIHFFQPTANFEGDFSPEWADPVMRIPLGLEPVNVITLANRRFTITQKTNTYIVVNTGGKELVFFPGFPHTEDVFDTPRVLEQLSEKQNMAAAAMLGKHFRVMHSPNLNYRTRPGGLNHSFDPSVDKIDFVVKDVIANRNEVLLAYQKDNEVLFLVIDKDSDFRLFEMDCISLAQRERNTNTPNVPALTKETINQQLNLISANENIAETILRDEALIASLYSRFQLRPNGLRGENTYTYFQAHEEEDISPCIKVNLDEKGNLFLQSVYSSEKGLYHTRVEIHIPGQEPLPSVRIPTLDKRSLRYQSKGLLVEKIRFPEGGDQGIIEAIARHCDQEITLRFVAGGSFFQDVKLEQAFKEEIRDAFLFSCILKAKN